MLIIILLFCQRLYFVVENGIDSIDLITQLVQDKSFEETVPRLGDRLKIKRKLSLSQK